MTHFSRRATSFTCSKSHYWTEQLAILVRTRAKLKHSNLKMRNWNTEYTDGNDVITSLMWKDMWGGVVYWTVLCYHPYLVSMLFADLLSLHLVIFLMFFILVYFVLYQYGTCAHDKPWQRSGHYVKTLNFKSNLTGYLTKVVRHTTQLIRNCNWYLFTRLA